MGNKSRYTGWSPSRWRAWQDCEKKYYFTYVKRAEVPITAEMAAGLMRHMRMLQFYKEDGSPKYKSAETFANSVKGPWIIEVVENSEIAGRKIKWRDPQEPYRTLEVMKRDLRAIYEPYSQEAPPLFTEQRFKVVIPSKSGYFCFVGRFDEIRLGERLAVRDHKSGLLIPEPEELAENEQFTIYSLALASLIENGNLERMLHTLRRPEDVKEKALGVARELRGLSLVEIAQNLDLEYHNMRTGGIIQVPRRTQESFDSLIAKVSEAERKISENYNSNIWQVNEDSCPKCVFANICDRKSQVMGEPTLFSLVNESRIAQEVQDGLRSDSFYIPVKQKEKVPKLPFPRQSRKKVNV